MRALKLRGQQIAALMIAIIGLLALTWFTVNSLRRTESHTVLSSVDSASWFVFYDVTIASFDPDLQIAQVKAAVSARPPVFVEDRLRLKFPDLPDGIDLNPERVRVLHEPLHVFSLDGLFLRDGLGVLQFSKCQRGNLPPLLVDKPSSEAVEDPEEVEGEIHPMGNPALYPFDEYLVLGSVSSSTFLQFGEPEKPHFWGSDGHLIDVRLPGFAVRLPSMADFSRHQRSKGLLGKEEREVTCSAAESFDGSLWRKNQFAFVLERPLLIRVLSVLLFMAALGFIWFVVSTSDRRQLGLNLLAYFSALWGIRSALGAAAPKTPSLIDYGCVFLYVAMILAILVRVLWGFEDSVSQSGGHQG
jgi:hypothetical protein